MITANPIASIPINANPFHHDAYRMGTVVAKNVLIMHETHPDAEAKYVIVVNVKTGERMRVNV